MMPIQYQPAALASILVFIFSLLIIPNIPEENHGLRGGRRAFTGILPGRSVPKDIFSTTNNNDRYSGKLMSEPLRMLPRTLWAVIIGLESRLTSTLPALPTSNHLQLRYHGKRRRLGADGVQVGYNAARSIPDRSSTCPVPAFGYRLLIYNDWQEDARLRITISLVKSGRQRRAPLLGPRFSHHCFSPGGCGCWVQGVSSRCLDCAKDNGFPGKGLHRTFILYFTIASAEIWGGLVFLVTIFHHTLPASTFSPNTLPRLAYRIFLGFLPF